MSTATRRLPSLTRHFASSRTLPNASQYHAKYAAQLQQRALQQGLSVEQLRQQALQQSNTPVKQRPVWPVEQSSMSPPAQRSPASPKPRLSLKERADKSPVRPLSDFMDFHRLFQSDHSPQQVTALWTAYHASKSDGTGRGFLSAAIPLDTYTKMLTTAQRFPSFLLPLSRGPLLTIDQGTPLPEDGGGHDFHYMQWDLHEAPPSPQATLSQFPTLQSAPFAHASTSTAPVNPPISTILFTPLQEYKLRQAFATPHLVLTLYTDLAHTHGLILLRGELTPSPSAMDGHYILSQQEAHSLAFGVQRFYLPTAGDEDVDSRERAGLLSTFHLKPHEFRWEDLLKHASPTGHSPKPAPSAA